MCPSAERLLEARRSALILMSAICVPGCALVATPERRSDTALLERMRASNYLLLGEMHDHPEQHRIRLEWLRKLSQSSPIALVLEHFDADSQARIDAARLSLREGSPRAEQARELAQAAGFRFDGWDWTLIGPVVELALERNVPLIAGNLSARETYSIARGQPHPLDGPAPSGWRAQNDSTLSGLIRDGHCGLLPESMINPMVRAQRARDAKMAATLAATRATGRKPVLLAGNVHVRTDVGVPAHLRALDPNAATMSVGMLEEGSSEPSDVFDSVWVTSRIDRPDPCEDLRRRFEKPGSK
jgi:uncharacterized iron-regulated protein